MFMSRSDRPVGFRRSTPFGEGRIPWRFWIGPLLITGAPSVGWTR